MAFKAYMKDGTFVALKAKTVSEAIGWSALTGSLSASNDAWIETADGGAVRYSDVQRFEKDNDDA